MRSRAANMAGFTLLPVILAMSLIAAIAFLLNRDNGINAGMVAVQGDAARARYVAEAGLQAINAITQGKDCAGYTDLSPTPTAFGAGSFTATVNPKSGTPVTLTATGTTAGGASASLTRANVAVSGSQTLTLQPDAAGGKDTSLNVNSVTANYGALGSIKVHNTTLSKYRGLVQFDLSSIPAGSQITGATLQLSKTTVGTDPGTIAVHRVTRQWVEGTQSGAVSTTGVTYNTSDGTTPWTTAGGDYDPAAVATLTNIGAGFNSWDVTSLVQGWRDGSHSNFGMILVPTTVDVFVTFDSSDYSNAANHPKLVVTFLGPCGAPPPPPPPPPGPPPPPVSPVTLPAIKDTWINEAKAGMNYGSSISFTVTNAASRGRGLVQFDLSTIPAGTRFTSATLRLFAGGFSPTVPPTSSILTVNPVLAPWTENGATWKTANGSMNSWLCGCWGGYFAAAAASATLSSSFTPGSWVEWDVTALAQEWLDGIRLNYGVGVLINTASAVAFNSKEATFAPQYVPQLVLAW